MSSYIEQLTILRDTHRGSLQKQVEEFLDNKCLKRVVFYVNNSHSDKIPKHEAYVYYTDPFPPEISLTYSGVIGGVKLTITLFSFISIELKEVGVVYSTNPFPTIEDSKLLFPKEYGTNSEILLYSQMAPNTLSYIRPYVKSCLGITYGNQISVLSMSGIGFDIIEVTLIVY